MIFLLFVACSSDHFSGVPSAASIVAGDWSSSDPVASPVDAETVAAASRGLPPPLTVNMPEDTGGFIELRAYRTDTEGEVAWTGRALSQELLPSAGLSIVLPPMPPKADRTMDSTQPVVYAITARAEDADGEPGIYTGLAQARLVWYRASPPTGANVGWNLVLDLDKDDPTWLDFNLGVLFDENLVAPETFAIGGRTEVEVGPATHAQLATEGGVSAFDQQLFPDWSLALTDAPPSSALSDRDDHEGAELALYAYEDDGDNVRSEEAILGEACFGALPVVVSWMAYAHDLSSAIVLSGLNRRAGWDLLLQSSGGLVPATLENRESLVIREVCE